jgi:hypothetical protein
LSGFAPVASVKSIIQIYTNCQFNRSHFSCHAVASYFRGQGIGKEPKAGLVICLAEEKMPFL